MRFRKTHVEGAVLLKCESALCPIELIARKPEVKQYSACSFKPGTSRCGFEIGENRETLGIFFEECLSVTASPRRGIHKFLPAARGEKLYCFFIKNRDMHYQE